MNEARKVLSKNENLLNRMFNLMNIKIDEVSETEENSNKSLEERKIDAVIKNMWKFNQTYKISTDKMVII